MGLQQIDVGPSHGLQISWETSALKSAKIFRVRWFRNFYIFNYFTAIADDSHTSLPSALPPPLIAIAVRLIGLL